MNLKKQFFTKQSGQIMITIKEYWRMILLTSVFICGLIIGAYVVKGDNSLLSGQLFEIIKSAILKKNSLSFLKCFIESFIFNCVFLILTFSFGLCAIGIPAIGIIPLIKGFSIGVTGAYIYSNYSIKGVCYCLFVFFPAQILMSAILIFACNESLYMSEDLFVTLNKGIIKEKNLAGLYLTRFALLLFFSCGIALADAFLSKIFSSVFLLF